MSDSSRHVKLLEIRPGLFRIQWKFKDMDEEGIYTKEFKLNVSQSQRSYRITYRLNKVTKASTAKYGFKYQYKIVVEEIVESAAEKVSKSSGPLYMWINSEVLFGNEISLKQKLESGKWRRHRLRQTPRKSLTLWIDFGTSTENERNLISGIAQMFYTQSCCDVLFHFSDGHQIGAHVSILSAGSSVFSIMLNRPDPVKRTVEIGRLTTYDIFYEILTFLYTGSVPKFEEKDDGMMQLLYQAADSFGVEALKRKCTNVLQKRVSLDNAINLLVWSHMHSITKLFEVTMEFIVPNLRDLCYQPQWKKLATDFPELCVMATQRIAGPPTVTIESDSDD